MRARVPGLDERPRPAGRWGAPRRRASRPRRRRRRRRCTPPGRPRSPARRSACSPAAGTAAPAGRAGRAAAAVAAGSSSRSPRLSSVSAAPRMPVSGVRNSWRHGADEVGADPVGLRQPRLHAGLPVRRPRAARCLGAQRAARAQPLLLGLQPSARAGDLVGAPEQHQHRRLGQRRSRRARAPTSHAVADVPRATRRSAPCCSQHEADGQRVHRPVLVERDDRDGDEVVEVRLGRVRRTGARRSGRAGEQAQRRGQRRAGAG